MAGWSKFMNEYPWILGIVFIITGLYVAFRGVRDFSYISAGLLSGMSALFVFVFVTSLGLMSGTVGMILSYLCAIAAAVVCWFVVRRYPTIEYWAVGGIAGYFLGFMLYCVFLAIGWNSVWGMMVFSIAGAIAGVLFAWRYPHYVVMECTTGIGSYMFMRGWSFIFGGYPSESVIISTIKSGGSVDFSFTFWIYISSFVAFWFLSYYY